MDDIDKMVVEEGVVKIKEPEQIIPEQVIPATETVIDIRALISQKEGLESHINELQQSVDIDIAQINSMQATVDKIDALLAQVPSDKNVPVDGANGVG